MALEIQQKDSKRECYLHPKWDIHVRADFKLKPLKIIYSISRSNQFCLYYWKISIYKRLEVFCQWLGNKLFTVWKMIDFFRWLDDFVCFGVLLKKKNRTALSNLIPNRYVWNILALKGPLRVSS